MGHVSEREGRAFESLLDWQHRQYEALGLACILYNGTKTRAISTREGLKFIPGLSLPDYIGCLRLGKCVAFEAKTTSEETWRLPKKRAHQRDILSSLATLGAVTWFAVESKPRETCFLLRVKPDLNWPRDPLPGIVFREYSGKEWNHPGSPVLTIARSPGGTYDWLSAVEMFWREFI